MCETCAISCGELTMFSLFFASTVAVVSASVANADDATRAKEKGVAQSRPRRPRLCRPRPPSSRRASPRRVRVIRTKSNPPSVGSRFVRSRRRRGVVASHCRWMADGCLIWVDTEEKFSLRKNDPPPKRRFVNRDRIFNELSTLCARGHRRNVV